MARRALIGALVVVTTAIGALVVGSGVAEADTSLRIELGTLRGMVVDTARGHVFLSGSQGNIETTGVGGVEVTDLSGANRSMVSGITSAGALAQAPDGTVFAAGDGVIYGIDPDTRAVTTHATPDERCITDLAATTGVVWFVYRCDGDHSQTAPDLAALDLSDGVVSTGLAPHTLAGFDRLISVPGRADLMALGETAGGNAPDPSVTLLSVSGNAVTDVGHVSPSSASAATAIALNADGSRLLVGDGGTTTEYRTSDLGVVRTVSTPNASAGAVAFSGDGHTIAVDASGADANGSYGSAITTFREATGAAVRTYDYRNPYTQPDVVNVSSPFGLAWGGNTLFAAHVNYLGERPTLRVLTTAVVAPVTVTVSGPATARRATTLTLTGTAVSMGSGLAGVKLTVKKTDMDGTHPLASVTTGSTGAFTVHDTPAVGGTNTYTVSFAGDATRAPVSKSFRVTVSRLTPSISLSTNHTLYSYGQRQYVKVHLGTTYRNRTITVSEREYGATRWIVVRTAAVDSHGNLATSFTARRNVTITARFNGDERYAPRTLTLHRHVRAYIRTVIGGSYAMSGRYHLFHQRTGGGLAVRVLPGKGGEEVRFRLQLLHDGVWRTVDTDVEYLNSDGITSVGFNGRTYTPLRIRAEFPGDSVNAAVVARWWYVQFR